MPSGNPSSLVKSIFADSLQAAMEHATVELGADAMLLDSREAPPEARHLGDYEVVFSTSPEPPAPRRFSRLTRRTRYGGSWKKSGKCWRA